MRVKITEIHSDDAWYEQRKNLVGCIGEFDLLIEHDGYIAGYFVLENSIPVLSMDAGEERFFRAIKVKEVGVSLYDRIISLWRRLWQH